MEEERKDVTEEEISVEQHLCDNIVSTDDPDKMEKCGRTYADIVKVTDATEIEYARLDYEEQRDNADRKARMKEAFIKAGAMILAAVLGGATTEFVKGKIKGEYDMEYFDASARFESDGYIGLNSNKRRRPR